MCQYMKLVCYIQFEKHLFKVSIVAVTNDYDANKTRILNKVKSVRH